MKQMIKIPSSKSIKTSYTQFNNTIEWNLSCISAPDCTFVTWSDIRLTIGWIRRFRCSEFSTILVLFQTFSGPAWKWSVPKSGPDASQSENWVCLKHSYAGSKGKISVQMQFENLIIFWWVIIRILEKVRTSCDLSRFSAEIWMVHNIIRSCWIIGRLVCIPVGTIECCWDSRR